MKKETKRTFFDFVIIFLLLILLKSIITSDIIFTLFSILAIIVCVMAKIKNEKKIIKNKTNKETKKCKFCQSEIDNLAIVCPICKRNQSNANNPLLLIPITGILLLFYWYLFSNNAPKPVKEILCGLGIKEGKYCIVETRYEIEIKIKN